MKYKICCILLGLIIFMNGCKKSKYKLLELNGNNYRISSFNAPRTLIDPSNSNNPYDKIGYLHNIGMEAVGNCHLQCINVDNTTKEKKLEELRASFGKCVNREFRVSNSRSVWMNYCSGIYKNYISNKKYYVDSLSGINVLQRKWLSILFNLVDVFNVGDSTVDNKIRALTKFKANIVRLEDALIINDSFSEKEKALLLSASSVARYSLVYIISTLSNPESPWIIVKKIQSGTFNNNTNNSSSEIRTFAYVNGFLVYADWGAIGRADISGAIGGAVAGATGLFIPGVGWTEWGVAVLGGGLGNSASEFTNQLLSGNVLFFP
jgi:hypothetical protein